MIKKNSPSLEEMKELESLFELNKVSLLEEKTKNLISKYPNTAILYNILGVVLQKKNDFNNAINNFKKAIDINPNFDQAHNNYGNALQNIKKFNEAILSYKTAIKINNKYAEAHNNLGNALAEQGNFNQALISLKKAIQLNSKHPAFYSNLGSALTELGKFEEAIKNHQKAIKLNPNYAEAYSNLGIALGEIDRFEEAIKNHQKAIKLNPNYKKAILNESFVRLSMGDFENGWKLHEERLGNPNNTPLRYDAKNLWDGKYLNGTLLVWCEQGLGDHIIFGSMLIDLKNYAKKIILETDKRLVSLFKRFFEKEKAFNIEIVALEKKLISNFDKHIAIGSLGKYLRKTRKSFEKTPKKYLISSQSKEEIIKNFIKKNKLNVGISWKTLNKKQLYRNIKLEQMLAIFKNKKCNFINLQFGDTQEDLQILESKHGVKINSIKELDNFNDIEGLAALINCLDLVITIQNTTAHLSGALGKNTWVMLVRNARWHWIKNEKKSIWYPSANLYRQETYGDWNNVINNIDNDLKSLIKKKKIL